MNEDKIIQKLVKFKHPDLVEALQCVSKSKLKTGKERFVLLTQAKEKLYPLSGDQSILQIIAEIDKII